MGVNINYLVDHSKAVSITKRNRALEMQLNDKDREIYLLKDERRNITHRYEQAHHQRLECLVAMDSLQHTIDELEGEKQNLLQQHYEQHDLSGNIQRGEAPIIVNCLNLVI